jgi:hypothetical protein
MLPLIWLALAIVTGTWLALLALGAATRRFARMPPSVVILGGQIGAAAMTLPGFWLSVFIGAPLFGGMAIEVAGSRAMQLGALLGVGVTQFVCVALGGAVGVSLSLLYDRVAHRRGAKR